MTQGKSVTIIPARVRVGNNVTKEVKPKLRVAAYCRVSTDSDEQATSYEAQVEHYAAFIKKNEEWEFAGIFADATDIIGLKQNPTNGRRFSPIFHLSGIFRYKTRKCYF